jgi:GTPase SAR1 family protein
MNPISTTPAIIRNYNALDEKQFHKLVGRIFELSKGTNTFECAYDNSSIPPRGSDEGVDIALFHQNQSVGNIQCKRYEKLLDKPYVAKEIIRFLLYSIKNPLLIDNIDNFFYYLAVSTGVNKLANTLINTFNSTILKEKTLDEWISEEMAKPAFKDLENGLEIEKQVKNKLSKIKIRLITPTNLDSYLAQYESIISEFFQVQKVVDNHLAKDANETLKRIEKILNPDINAKIKSFEESYKKAASSKLEPIDFIGYSTNAKNKPRTTITKLYVEPFFKVKRQIREEGELIETFEKRKQTNLRLHDLFKRTRHYIVLGDPGAGKSLLVRYIMLQIFNNTFNRFGLKEYSGYIPFRIELRKYNDEKASKSIIDYLHHVLHAEYNIANITIDILNQIIEYKDVLFFFDGLDEIFDAADKIEIRDRIECFVAQYKNIKAIVTSRFNGYNDAPFDEEQFYEVAIQDFNSDQINEFITKLYKAHIPNKEAREVESEFCKQQIAQMENDFKNNPLILSLMVLLAVNNFKIPESKLEIYRSCAETLSYKRDKIEKNMAIDWKVRNRKGTFGYLAFWQYQETTKKTKITPKLTENAITDYLKKNDEYSSQEVANEVAQHFLRFAEQRSIYFENTFTHKTFLEYFTAEHILQTYHNDVELHDERNKILEKYIAAPYWSIVFELFYLMVDESVSNNNVLDKLIVKQLERKLPEVHYFFLNITLYLNNISDILRARVLKDSIYFLLEKDDKTQSAFVEDSMFLRICGYIYNPKYKQIIVQCIRQIEEEINDDKKIINFYILCKEFQGFQNVFEENETLQPLNLILNMSKLETLQQQNYILFRHYNEPENLSEYIDKIVSIFGKEAFFMEYRIKNIFPFGIFWHSGSLFQHFFMDSNVNNIKKFKRFLNKIKSFGITRQDLLEHKDAIQIPNIEYIVSTYLDSKEEELDEILELMFPFSRRDVTDSHFNEHLNEHFSKHTNFIKLTTFLDRRK